MKKQTLALTCILAAFAASPVWADDDGWQVSVGGAQSTQNNQTSKMIEGRLRKEISPFFALEGEAAFALSRDKVGDVSVGVKNYFGAFGVLKSPEIAGFEVFGRAGIAGANISSNVGNVSVSDKQAGLAFGGGAQYYIDDTNGIRFDFTRNVRNGANLNVYSLTYTRKF